MCKHYLCQQVQKVLRGLHVVATEQDAHLCCRGFVGALDTVLHEARKQLRPEPNERSLRVRLKSGTERVRKTDLWSRRGAKGSSKAKRTRSGSVLTRPLDSPMYSSRSTSTEPSATASAAKPSHLRVRNLHQCVSSAFQWQGREVPGSLPPHVHACRSAATQPRTYSRRPCGCRPRKVVVRGDSDSPSCFCCMMRCSALRAPSHNTSICGRKRS